MADKKTKTDAEKAKEKAEKLRELAAIRVPKAVNAVNIVGNLANYAPTKTQAAFIVEQLESAVKNVKARFAGQTTDAGFQLPA
jgi:hypothetical protein